MILAINVGNTNVTVGCIDRKKTYFIERISTQLNNRIRVCYNSKNIMEIYHISPKDIDGGIVSSARVHLFLKRFASLLLRSFRKKYILSVLVLKTD